MKPPTRLLAAQSTASGQCRTVLVKTLIRHGDSMGPANRIKIPCSQEFRVTPTVLSANSGGYFPLRRGSSLAMQSAPSSIGEDRFGSASWRFGFADFTASAKSISCLSRATSQSLAELRVAWMVHFENGALRSIQGVLGHEFIGGSIRYQPTSASAAVWRRFIAQ